jgi:hypothetical protein
VVDQPFLEPMVLHALSRLFPHSIEVASNVQSKSLDHHVREEVLVDMIRVDDVADLNFETCDELLDVFFMTGVEGHGHGGFVFVPYASIFL